MSTTDYPLEAQLLDIAEWEVAAMAAIESGTATDDDHRLLDEMTAHRDRILERAILEARAAQCKALLARRRLTRAEEEVDLDARGRLMVMDHEDREGS